MKQQILLIYAAIGPTYRQRMIDNIQRYSSYQFYDTLIITDLVEDFGPISNLSNVFIKNLDDLRVKFPWSYDLEKLPVTTKYETEYAADILYNQIRVPLCLRRFASEWEHIYDYRGLVFMDCDTTPRSSQQDYDNSIKFIYNPIVSIPEYNIENKTPNNIMAFGFIDHPGYDNYHSYLLDYANEINLQHRVTDRPIDYRFPISDGPFRAYRFVSEQQMKYFFSLIHSIVEDVLVYNKYDKMTQHSIWKIHVEYILAIVCNILNIETYISSPANGIGKNSSFKVECYPEDRFWSFSGGFENSTIGKLDFVHKNYDKLKTFYANNQQYFPY